MSQKIKKAEMEAVKYIARKHKLGGIKDINNFASGQVNCVLELNQRYIIKLESDLPYIKGVFRFQPEITKKLLARGVKVPEVVGEGKFEGRGYLVTQKAEGENLVYGWMDFTSVQRENMISQLASELKKIHSITFSNYAIPIYQDKKFPDLSDALLATTDFSRIEKGRLLPEYAETVEYLENFFHSRKSAVSETGTAVLAHNDMHFENIFYKGEKITGIIDWDWASQAPRDFDLWRLVYFCCSPREFVEDGLKKFYSRYRPTVEIQSLKKYYPEIFSVPNLPDRLRLYLLDHLITIISDYQSGKWDDDVMKNMVKKVDVFYKSDWVENFLAG